MIQKSNTFNFQRLFLGFTSLVFIIAGLFLAFANEGDNNSLSGILVRVGMMLGAIWLAYPVLQRPDGQHSLIMIGIMAGAVLIVAARPKLFIGAAIVLGIAALANWLLKKASAKL